MQRTHAAPVHCPSTLDPLITSQYVPSGIDVLNVVVHTVSSLLIATKPSEPGNGRMMHGGFANCAGNQNTHHVQMQSGPCLPRPIPPSPRRQLCCGIPPCPRHPSTDAGTSSRSHHLIRCMCLHLKMHSHMSHEMSRNECSTHRCWELPRRSR